MNKSVKKEEKIKKHNLIVKDQGFINMFRLNKVFNVNALAQHSINDWAFI
jgi:hypothetical protein